VAPLLPLGGGALGAQRPDKIAFQEFREVRGLTPSDEAALAPFEIESRHGPARFGDGFSFREHVPDELPAAIGRFGVKAGNEAPSALPKSAHASLATPKMGR
jgi:hypothetical protein